MDKKSIWEEFRKKITKNQQQINAYKDSRYGNLKGKSFANKKRNKRETNIDFHVMFRYSYYDRNAELTYAVVAKII